MNKFIGFALLELNKATGTNDLETARTYDITVYNKFGHIIKTNLKLNEIERDWCKVRKTGLSHAEMCGSDVRLLTAEQFKERLIEWETARAVQMDRAA